MYTLKKGEKHQIAKHFWSHEFDCQCKYKDCIYTLVTEQMIDHLIKLREILGPIHITNAYRCQRHQDDIRASGIKTTIGPSTHQMAMAVDIKTNKHSGTELEKVARENGFKAVGVAKDWIHIDLRNDKKRHWVY